MFIQKEALGGSPPKARRLEEAALQPGRRTYKKVGWAEKKKKKNKFWHLLLVDNQVFG